ncbi:MAG: universal stress protein [Dehalococcoidales bacterium]|nr:universal stress protein [Dehalococcoidales bacterium]
MYQKIVVPLDGSELAESVTPHVESIAKGCDTKEVIFLRVIEPSELPLGGPGVFDYSSSAISGFDRGRPAETDSVLLPSERERDRFSESRRIQLEGMRRDAAQRYLKENEDYLKQVIGRLSCGEGVTLVPKIIEGTKVADIISEFATKQEADLIIIATHGRGGVSRWAYGSVADRVLRSACVPVLMVRPPACVPKF